MRKDKGTLERSDWTSRERRIRLLECRACGQRAYLPAERCRQCGGDLRVIDSDGRGRCVALTRIPKKYGYADGDVLLALVELDDGPMMLAKRAPEVAMGDEVRLTFEASKESGTDGLVPVAVHATVGFRDRPLAGPP